MLKTPSVTKVQIDEVLETLKTPVDLTDKDNEKIANVLTFHFIGYLSKPIGVSDELYNVCLKAFNENRGKTEIEEACVLRAI